MNMKDKAGLGLAIHWIQQALVFAFEDNCSLRPIRKGRKSLKWTRELELLRKEVRRLFNRCRAKNESYSWELYREAQRRYRKEVRKASREMWRSFVSSVNDLPRAARIHRALSRDSKIRLGSLVAPSGLRTQSEGETLLATHFPGSICVEGGVLSATTCRTNHLNWQVAARIVTYRRVEWAINTFVPYKSPGVDGIFPALLQEGREVLIPYLIKIFRACLAMGYVPTIWHQVKVVFIPKPGRNSYCGPKDFRPISLTSFLLKTLEMLVDRFLRDEILVFKPLHPNQHAYQAGKSVETALHQLMVQIEKALDQQEVVLGTFLDIEGAFNNTSYDSMCMALARHGVDHTIVRWVKATLEGRRAIATLGGSSRSVTVSRGCPQGGVLSPLLWCLVVDDLLVSLSGGGVYAQGYADDICLLAGGKFPNTVSGLIQWALGIVKEWCGELGLSVNSDKTGLVVFTRKRKLPGFFQPHLFGKVLQLSTSVRYLGVTLDSRLTWKEHVDVKVRKAHNSLWACNGVWGMGPQVVHWLYASVIRPSVTFASLVWWPGCQTASAKSKLSKTQRWACLGITGAMRTTPTHTMEALICLPPLELVIQ
jgi:hypothetical protein